MKNAKEKSSNQNFLLLISVFSILCFLVLLFFQGHFFNLNQSVNNWAETLHNEVLTQATTVIANVFGTAILLVATFPVAGFFIYKRQVSSALLLVGAMGLTALLLQLFKNFVVSPRPLNGLMFEGDYSFPSGHVTSAIVFFGVLTYVISKNQKSLPLKIASIAVSSTLAILVAFDRLYLNVHWLTDVLAAPFLALFILAVSTLIVNRLTNWYINKLKQIPNLMGSYNSGTALCLRGRALYGRAITRTKYSLNQ